MAKKKSKTQKYKKNIKKKAKKLQQNTQRISTIKIDELKNKEISSKKNVEENKIKEINSKKPVEEKIDLPKIKKQETKKQTNLQKKSNSSMKTTILNKLKSIFDKKKDKKATKSTKNDIVLPKLKENQNTNKKNVFIRLFYELKTNIHIIFNTMLIIIFIILIIGLTRINVLKSSTIIYIACIILFLMTVAISYNKYLSGKFFTTILCIGMGFAIYEMQYTYDFVRNLNSNVYEYKTYYVVTFDNVSNRSIYSLNNKNIGLLKDNCINIERKLNTKLDKVDYHEYDDINILFNDFYNQKFRAILVNENQYKYLQNNIESNKKVKILYEFEANAKK